MPLPPFHGFNPDSADRVALITVQPSADRQLQLVKVERGPTRASLRQTALLGPYAEEDLVQHFDAAVAELRTEGYWPGGVLALLEALDHADSAVRGRAALRLGWKNSVEAVDKLLQILPDAVDDSCPILDALGMIGDERAVPVLREYAARKLLSRRRSGLEALRKCGDKEGVSEAQERSLQRLPEDVRAGLLMEDVSIAQIVHKLGQLIPTLTVQEQAVSIDTLYEMNTPASASTVGKVMTDLAFAQPYIWRAVKSVFKRAQLRQDFVMLGWLAHEIEQQGRDTKGTSATVKSGYDGTNKFTFIFSRATQNYLRRSAWRYLRDLARYRPHLYTKAAAEALIHYTNEDLAGGTFRSYVLHQILLGASPLYFFDKWKMAFRKMYYWGKKKPAKPDREERYPELWDEFPAAYIRLLAAANSIMVQKFAVEAVRNRHPKLLREAANRDILAMLQAPLDDTVKLALEELERRFDSDNPDWRLLRQLLDDERPMARTLGQKWLRLTAHLWLKDVDRILDFLGIVPQNIRAMVTEMAVGALADSPELRQPLAERIVTILRNPEAFPDEHAGYARVAREALLEEFAKLVSVADLAIWLAKGSTAVKTMAAEMLKHRPDSVGELGLERISALAQHELIAVRSAAHSLIRSVVPQLRADPSLLFVLVESEWPDTRDMAFDLLRTKIDIEALGLDGVMGLLDSNRVDVQDLGKELVSRNIGKLPSEDLVRRLTEHPHPNMHQFALDLAVEHLPKSRESLLQLKGFCRAALLNLWPSKKVKHLAIDLLAKRGVEDTEQGEVAAAILGDIVRMQGRRDFENALEALVRIKLAHPDLSTTVEIPGGEE